MTDTKLRDEPLPAAAAADAKELGLPLADPDPEPATAPAPAGQYDQVTGIKLGIMLLSLALACFLILLDVAVVSTAVPKITDDFHSLRDVGWYASSYQLGSTVLQLLTGKIFHHFSLKWSFISFFFIFELGSALSGAAQSSAMLIISRAVSGIGASGLINGALTIVSASVPLERRPSLTGALLGVAQIGVVLGPLIGGAFTTGYTWRWCFYINLPLGVIVAVPLILLRIPDQVPKQPPMAVVRQLHRHLDLVGFALFAPAIVMLLLAMQFGGNQFAWHSSQVIGLFVGAGVTFLVWLAWNYHKGDDALLPFPIVRRRRVWLSGVNYGLLTTTVVGSAFFLPIYFQAIKGVSAIMSGVYLLATILPQALGAVSSGVLVSKVGYVPPFSIVGSVLFSIGAGLYTLLQPATSEANWVGFQIISGFGRGISFQMPIVAIQHAVSPQELSAGMAFVVWCQYLGPSIFLTLFNTVFDTKLQSNLKKYAPNTDAALVLEAGATGFRNVVAPADIPGILQAYADSLDIVFYMILAVSLVCFLTAWGMGFNDIRKTQQVADEAAAAAGSSGSDTSAPEKASTTAAAGTAGAAGAAETAAPAALVGDEKQRSDGSKTDH
ncbi:hypothetical protein SCUCBS95973_009841 [Sporothrix curviconia]|uniref:Major facilitator superfamily (MFS) profile domain-containing protein n=1 Tax=Sporothrix curviconia TaxID=1260050 RepID=A0ABP0CZD0_9PEZI